MTTDITITKETITPNIAAQWRGLVHKNRHERRRTVERYTGAMLRGEWEDNGETIKFNGDGTPVDGQHRLAAIVAVGQINPDFSMDMWVVRNLSDKARTTLDTGAKRTVADELAIRGVPNANAIAGALSKIWQYTENVSNNGAPTTPVAIELLDTCPALQDSLPVGRKVNDVFNVVTPSTASAAHYLMSQIDADRASEFFNALIAGANLAPTSPVLKLRKYLSKMIAKRNRGVAVSHRGVQRDILAALIFAWNDDNTVGKSAFIWDRKRPFPKFTE